MLATSGPRNGVPNKVSLILQSVFWISLGIALDFFQVYDCQLGRDRAGATRHFTHSRLHVHACKAEAKGNASLTWLGVLQTDKHAPLGLHVDRPHQHRTKRDATQGKRCMRRVKGHRLRDSPNLAHKMLAVTED